MPPCQFGLTNEHDGPRLFRTLSNSASVEVKARARRGFITSGRTPPVKRPVTLDHARRANDVAWSVVAVHYMYNYVK
jgi:hypothetical protein